VPEEKRTRYLYLTIWLMLSFCFAVVSAGFAAEETRVHWIDLNQMKKIIEEQAPVIVDLRTPREFEQGHIPGAVNVPVDDLRANRALLDAYKDQPVLLYCRTVNRTGRALWLLEGLGFKMIYALNGGYADYRIKNQ